MTKIVLVLQKSSKIEIPNSKVFLLSLQINILKNTHLCGGLH